MIEFFQQLGVGIVMAFKGAPTTLGVSALAVVVGLVLGFLLAFMRMSKIKVLRGLSTFYVDVVRGTPLVVQVFIAAYGIPTLIQNNGGDFRWSSLMIPALIMCGCNSAAYMAEIVRGGLQAVDPGQLEAAASLGMTHSQAMRLVVVPQAIRIIMPALGNEFITMIKETAVLSFAGVVEIMRRGALYSAATFNTFPAYLGVAIVYLVFTIPLSKLVLVMEKKMSDN
ncbi:MAG: amino acid ABC transporter permease [Eubacteriales bacterium]|nr:amino acid ABC transporter permease [Eubacteriales bacterium]